MKRMIFIWILFLTSFFFACGGTNSAKKIPEPLTTGMRETTKGITQYKKGCYKDALAYFFKAHEQFTATDYQRGVAMSYNNIGNVYRASGDNKSAVLFFKESFSIYENIGDAKGAVQVLSNKAATLIDDNMLEDATKTLNAAKDIAKKNEFLFGPLLNTNGILFIKKGEYTSAEKVLQTALTTVDPENFSESATVNFTLGSLMFETQRYEQAIYFFRAALKADRLSGFSKGIADDLAAIGSTLLLQEKNDIAVNFLKRSLKIYALLGNQKKVYHIMQKLENVSERTEVDLSLTKYFVNRWLEGKSSEQPCD